MPHDVFISYSSHDKTAADAVCAVMEHRGIRCWMAPRDITPGQDWATSIIQAINGSKVFLLIFSAASNESGQVKREVERAANRNLPIIPFRITDMAPNETLEFFISTPHWLDAFTPPLHRHAERLADTVERLIGPPKGWPEPEVEIAAAKSPKPVTAPPPPLETAPPPPRPEVEVTPPASGGFSDHAPFFLLASAVIGACAYSSSLLVFGFWMNTPVYGVVVAFALWRWGKIGIVQAVIWVAVMTGAHFLAYTAAVDLSGKVFKEGPLNYGFCFLVGGLIGSMLSLLGLALLGRALANRANLVGVLIWTVVLGLAGGVSGLLSASFKFLQLTLYVPWQIIFGFAILAVAQGQAVPKLVDQAGQGFWPSSSARGGVIFAVLVAAAALTVTLVKPDLFKSKTDTTPTAVDTTPAPPAQDAAVGPGPAPAANPSPAATEGAESFSPH